MTSGFRVGINEAGSVSHGRAIVCDRDDYVRRSAEVFSVCDLAGQST